MKLTTILLFWAVLSVSAEGFSQVASISMKMENASLKEVFQELTARSEYTFVYSEKMISDVEIDLLNLDGATFEEALQESLNGTDLEYYLEGKVIVIRKKDPVVIQKEEQEKKIITGQVTDKNGIALPGVSVVIKGTNTGVATDIDGNYSLEIENDNAVLIFSFVGMLPQEIVFEGQSVQNITLTADSEQMAEVVVTGYQTISKERATGSFAMLDSDDISNSPNETIGDNLESLVAGVQTTVDEDGNTQIVIRGASTLTGNGEPLVVVDGYAVEGGFESINRNDVAKMTVLKDAAAASIWGARAANGVIVITTKNGSRKKGIEVSIDAYTKFSEKVDLDYVNPIASSESQLQYELMLWQQNWRKRSLTIGEVLDGFSKGHMEFQKQYEQFIANGADPASTDLPFTLDTPELQKLMKQSYKNQVKDQMLRNKFSQNYSISLRGQGERNRYSLSVMYNDNKQVMKEDNDYNLLVNFKNSMKINDWLEFDIAVMEQIKNSKSGGVGLEHIKAMAPYESLLDDEGNYTDVALYRINGDITGYHQGVMGTLHDQVTGWAYDDMSYNPLREMRARKFETKQHSSRINAGLKFKIAEGIKYKFGFQYEKRDINAKNRYTEDSYYTRNFVNRFNITDYNTIANGLPYGINPETDYQVPKGEIVHFTDNSTVSYLFRNQLDLIKTFGDHSFNFAAGTEVSWSDTDIKGNRQYGYNHATYMSVIPNQNNELPIAYSNGGTANLWSGFPLSGTANRNFSLFSNLAYTYKDKYTLSGSIRTDASNFIVDEPKYRYSPFWSVGSSWQISKEDFMSKDWVNSLILKATYGVNGNINLSTTMVPTISYLSATSGGAGIASAKLDDLGNPDLRWEKVKQLNLALEFSLFSNKLYGSVEYYNKKSEDLVASISLPSTDGSSSQAFNVASMKNNGVELNLNAKIDITKDFSFRPRLNYAYNKSKVTEVKELYIPMGNMKYRKPYVEGYEYMPIWGLKYNGLDENGIPTVLAKNEEVYKAIDGITNLGLHGPDALWNHGTKVAPHVASLTNELRYKGFSLLATVTGKFGHKMYTDGFSYSTRLDTHTHHKNLNNILAGNYEEVGEFPLPTEKVDAMSFYGSAASLLDSRIEDASYIRMKEVMLSYYLPKSLTAKLGIGSLKLYTHVSNLGLLWKANDKGIDPEYPMNMSYFKPERTYTLGLNLKF